MTTGQDIQKTTNRKRLIFLVIGLVGLTTAILGAAFGAKDRFFQAYLVAFLFWLGVSLGTLAFLMTHFLTGSRWGLTIRRVNEAAAGTLWLMALLFIPLLFDLPGLFAWARPEVVQSSEILQQKSLYLNVPFFIGRAVFYFLVWIGLAFFINRLSARWAMTGDQSIRERLKGWGAFGLIAYTLTTTFAAIDWMMSLEPFWSSTVFGLIIIFGQMVSGLAFGAMVLNGVPELGLGRKWTLKTTPVPYKDLGTLILTFIMSWAYLAYFQLLIIWAGNLPREVTWYVNRTTGGWMEVGVLVAVALFALPFALLLTMRVRHNLQILAWLSGLIVLASWVNVYWQVIPSFYPGKFSLYWLDLVLPVGMGGLWMAVFLTSLAKRPLLREEEQALISLGVGSHPEAPAAEAETT